MKKTLFSTILLGATLSLVACTDNPEPEVAPEETERVEADAT